MLGQYKVSNILPCTKRLLLSASESQVMKLLLRAVSFSQSIHHSSLKQAIFYNHNPRMGKGMCWWLEVIYFLATKGNTNLMFSDSKYYCQIECQRPYKIFLLSSEFTVNARPLNSKMLICHSPHSAGNIQTDCTQMKSKTEHGNTMPNQRVGSDDSLKALWNHLQ